jgi:hypothetical protein
MIQDHQKTSTELKALVEGSMVKLTLPASLDSEHQRMLDELNAKSGGTSTPAMIRFKSRLTETRWLCSRPIQKAARTPN